MVGTLRFAHPTNDYLDGSARAILSDLVAELIVIE
jgi:hypothetical protein